MDEKSKFIVEHLEMRANAILGFIVIQSLFLADRLSKADVVSKINGIPGLYNYIFIGHLIIVVFAIVFLAINDHKVSKYLDIDLKKALQPHITLIIKIIIAILFGSIPIYIIIGQMSST